MAHDVFICYSEADRQIAESTCATLEASNINCWIAPRNIAAGETWTDAIMDGISSSRAMVVIWSATASSSPYVALEIKHACTQGVIVILFRVENVRPSRDLNFFLAFVQWLDVWALPVKERYRRLAEAVKAKLEARGGATNLWVDGGERSLPAPSAQNAGARKRPPWLQWLAAACVLILIAAGGLALAWRDSRGGTEVFSPTTSNEFDRSGKQSEDKFNDRITVITKSERHAQIPKIPINRYEVETVDKQIKVVASFDEIRIFPRDERPYRWTILCIVTAVEFDTPSKPTKLIFACADGTRQTRDLKTGDELD